MSSTNIYVLQLKSGKYYVGQTNKVAKRFEEHKEGKGSAWTSTYKPVKVLEVCEFVLALIYDCRGLGFFRK